MNRISKPFHFQFESQKSNLQFSRRVPGELSQGFTSYRQSVLERIKSKTFGNKDN